jgi:hypothetical protein
MKKLLMIVGALTASIAGTAQAEISTSGYSEVNVVNVTGDAINSADDMYMEQTTKVSFAFSTETTGENPIAITAGTGFEYGDDKGDELSGNGQGNVSFAMNDMTVTIGETGTKGAFGAGNVAAGFSSAHQISTMQGTSFATGTGADLAGEAATGTGQGIAINTAMGDMTLDLSYVLNAGSDHTSYSTATSDVKNILSGNLTWADIGGATLSIGAAGGENELSGHENISSMGGSLSYVSGDFTLNVAGSSQSNAIRKNNNNIGASLAYAMNADTTVSVGARSASAKIADGATTNTSAAALGNGVVFGEKDEASSFSANITRSLGGGVSIFADYYSESQTDNTNAAADASSVTLGTSVSF